MSKLIEKRSYDELSALIGNLGGREDARFLLAATPSGVTLAPEGARTSRLPRR